eukprot:jgi/Psemu1/28894/gm1.28894_g
MVQMREEIDNDYTSSGIPDSKKYQPEQALSIENFNKLDSTKDEHILAFDDTNPSLRIFAKVSRKFAKRHLVLKNNIKVLRKFAPEIVGAKPTVARGQKCGSINDDYAIIGTKHETGARTDNSGNYIEPFVDNEMDVLSQILTRTQLNAIGQQALAFSIGRNYHYRCHVDDDMYYTRLAVIAPSGVPPDEVIYYFVFPTYHIKVPLRSGDTLLFNPLVFHSCSNPQYEGCYIMSAYVSRKTVLRSNPL